MIHLHVTLAFDPLNALHNEFIKWHQNVSTEQLTTAAIIGYSILNSNIITKEADTIAFDLKKQFDQEVQRLKKEHQDTISKLQIDFSDQIARTKAQCSQDIGLYKEHYVDEWIKKYETLFREYNQYIRKESENVKLQSKDKEIQTLQESLTAALQKLNVYQQTNMFKGLCGEKRVAEVLSQAFPSYEILDTSGTAGMSDIHLVDSSNNIIVIECKNKSTISAQDVQKSMHDIKLLKSKYKERFVGYFFISIRSKNIPKKGELCFECIESTPVIWYGATENCTKLDDDIVKFTKLLQMLNSHASKIDDSVSKIQEYIQKTLEIKKQVENINGCILQMRKNIETLQKPVDWLYADMMALIGINQSPQQTILMCPHCDATYKRKGDYEKHIATKHRHTLDSNT